MPAFIDKLAWIHIVERKLLAARSRGKTLFYFPGGKRDADEQDHESLVREIREELSIDLKPATIIPAGVFRAQADAMPTGVEVRMACFRAEFDGVIRIANEIDEVRWLSSADRALFSAVGRQVLDQLVQENLVD